MWQNSFYRVHVDYLEVLKILRRDIALSDKYHLFSSYLRDYFDLFLVSLDNAILRKDGRLLHNYQRIKVVHSSDIHPTRKDYFRWDGRSKTVSLCVVSCDGYAYLKKTYIEALKTDFQQLTPAVSCNFNLLTR